MDNIGQAAIPDISNRQVAVAAMASCLGWALDLFDLFILLYVAPVVGRLFFPSQYPTLSLAGVYASFAVTLLVRPIGSAIFGSYADTHGRKSAMVIAVVGVGIATALFGALPTIQQIGVAAPIIFLLLRLIQGIFVGGVVASTHTIGTESVPVRWQGLMSGMVGGGGAGVGGLLASIAFLVASALFPGEAFAVWGWRCMFFMGIISSVLGLVIFTSLEESPIWQARAAARAGRQRAPLRALFTPPNRAVLLVNLLLTFGAGAGYYLTSGFLPSFLKVVNNVPNSALSTILILASLVAIVASLAVGYLSDLIGRRPTFLVMGVIRLFALPALVLLMAGTSDLDRVAFYAFALAFLGNAGYAPLLIFLNERFPTAVRASGTGLSWNIGFALGGMMPTFVSLASPSPADLPLVLAVFLAAISVVFLAGALVVPETRGKLVV